METERLIIDSLRETDREDYFRNISHDRKVLETFICQYAENLEEVWGLHLLWQKILG